MCRPRLSHWAIAALAVAFSAASAPAHLDLGLLHTHRLDRTNAKLAGRVLDYTNNHDGDRRIWSPALQQWRGVYVYLPPGYDGTAKFPVMLWLHGVNQTERNFLGIVDHFDEGIRAGTFPPVVIVAPDGSVRNRVSLVTIGSWYMNSKAGAFEDYVIRDVWGWALRCFAVRPEREAHVIAGASMGGYGAYNLAFKHREQFGHVVGIMPALDTQYCDCHGRYFADYDPNCVGRRTEFRRSQVVGRFGPILVRQRRLLDPLFGRFGGADLDVIRTNNPTEMLGLYDIRPGEFNLFAAYPTEDEFNVSAHVQHFADVAARRGVHVHVVRIEGGHHTVRDGVRSFPALSAWLTPLLAPYVPNGCVVYRCSPELRARPLTTGVVRPSYLAPLPAAPGTLALR